MRRRSVLSLLALTATLGPAVLGPTAVVRAQPGLAQLRIVGRARDGQARFRLVNRTSDALTYTTYDGGSVHNGLERLDASGAWTDVGLGYCGLGMDGPVTGAPGGAQVFGAYVGTDAGTHRIRVRLERRTASGTTVTDDAVSEPFRVG